MKGKGWSSGLTAATDDRVARIRALTGRPRFRRKPYAELAWIRKTYTTLPIRWSPEMAYVVGLTATDGCLIRSRKAINFKSADREQVETFLRVLGRTNHIGVGSAQFGGTVYKTQFGDARLYEWFESVGLTPRKSLTLGAIDVPNDCLAPLVRGLLDRDGNIVYGRWRADTSRRSDYFYDWLRVRFYSASSAHLEWLQMRLAGALGLRGWRTASRQHATVIGALGYGKHDSLKLLAWLSEDPAAPHRGRRRITWLKYLNDHGLPAGATPTI